MELIVIIVFIVIGIILFFIRSESHQTSIESKINSLGGSLNGYERCNIITGLGPFMVVGKGRVIYRIDYEVDGIRKEGWVRFGGITGPDWRM